MIPGSVLWQLSECAGFTFLWTTSRLLSCAFCTWPTQWDKIFCFKTSRISQIHQPYHWSPLRQAWNQAIRDQPIWYNSYLWISPDWSFYVVPYTGLHGFLNFQQPVLHVLSGIDGNTQLHLFSFSRVHVRDLQVLLKQELVEEANRRCEWQISVLSLPSCHWGTARL